MCANIVHQSFKLRRRSLSQCNKPGSHGLNDSSRLDFLNSTAYIITTAAKLTFIYDIKHLVGCFDLILDHRASQVEPALRTVRIELISNKVFLRPNAQERKRQWGIDPGKVVTRRHYRNTNVILPNVSSVTSKTLDFQDSSPTTSGSPGGSCRCCRWRSSRTGPGRVRARPNGADRRCRRARR